jgi:hypothetical protein
LANGFHFVDQSRFGDGALQALSYRGNPVAAVAPLFFRLRFLQVAIGGALRKVQEVRQIFTFTPLSAVFPQFPQLPLCLPDAVLDSRAICDEGDRLCW